VQDRRASWGAALEIGIHGTHVRPDV
jgi:hypothetical protein